MSLPDLVADRYGRGSAVALLHGQPGTAADWHAVIPLLSDDFTVLVPDRLGYGRTGGGAGSFAANASSLAALLDRLSIPAAIVVGFSWGGGVALAFAEFYPTYAAGLVLAASVGPGQTLGRADRLLAPPIAGDAVATVYRFVGQALGGPTAQGLADRRLHGRPAAVFNRVTRLTGVAAGRPDSRSVVTEQQLLLRELPHIGARLARVSAPTAVVNGSRDDVVAPAVSARLVAGLPRATHTVVPDGGHMLPISHPGVIAAAVREVASGPAAGEVTALYGEEATDREG